MPFALIYGEEQQRELWKMQTKSSSFERVPTRSTRQLSRYPIKVICSLNYRRFPIYVEKLIDHSRQFALHKEVHFVSDSNIGLKLVSDSLLRRLFGTVELCTTKFFSSLLGRHSNSIALQLFVLLSLTLACQVFLRGKNTFFV